MLGHPGEGIQDQTHCFDSAYICISAYSSYGRQLCVFCFEAPWGWPSRGGAVLYWLSPQLGEDPPCWGPGVMWSSGGTRVAQLVARSTSDRCVVGSSPTRGTEHFGFPPVLRDWVIKGLRMSSLVYATEHIKNPVPLIEKSRGLSPGGQFPPSFIHQVIIITGLNKCWKIQGYH